MHKHYKNVSQGFTIVELLIVVVVVAILAAISIVAYTGIQNRANDTAIQNDLSNFAKKIQIATVDTSEFPAGGAVRSGGVNSGRMTVFPGFTFNPSKPAYMTTTHNLFYCTGTETVSGQKVFRVFARSRSGNLFVYSSNGGAENRGDTGINEIIACQGMNDPQTHAYGYHTVNGWYGWTNG